MELAVNVTAYLERDTLTPVRCWHGSLTEAYRYGSRDCDDIAFFNEKLACLVAQLADLRFGDWAAGTQLRDSSGLRIST